MLKDINNLKGTCLRTVKTEVTVTDHDLAIIEILYDHFIGTFEETCNTAILARDLMDRIRFKFESEPHNSTTTQSVA